MNKCKREKSSETGSTTSQISTRSIERIIDKLRMQRHRDSTRKNYYSIWKLFNKFILNLDRKPCNWEDRLTLFVGCLIDDDKQSSTVKSYISAIKAVLAENDIELNENTFLLNSLTRACRLVNDQIRTRLPICKPMLSAILNQIDKHFTKINQQYLRILYMTLFSTMYFGLFRIGELAQGEHPVKAKDVYIASNKKKILFLLRTSKTHWKNNKPQIIKITSYKKHQKPVGIIKKIKDSSKELKFPCPYKLLRKYIRTRRKSKSPEEPFFVFADNSPVKPCHVRNCLRTAIIGAGFQFPELYTVHSIRAGRTSDLMDLGLSIETIKKIGRWKSNAIFRYLR